MAEKKKKKKKKKKKMQPKKTQKEDSGAFFMSSHHDITLFSYWRSSSSWRVRLALHFKQLSFRTSTVNLLKNEQLTPEYLSKVNPQGLVPALQIDGLVLTESMAILEYLEETCPQRKILPSDAPSRAQARRIAQMVVADIQPVQNLKGFSRQFFGFSLNDLFQSSVEVSRSGTKGLWKRSLFLLRLI
jgi:glutathione S-transferase